MHLTDVRACLPCSDDVDARVKLAAKDIARHVQMTAQLVEQLNRLVQRRSLFNDPAQQINDSTAVIKKNLSQQKAQLAALVKLTASRGGSEGVRVPRRVVCGLCSVVGCEGRQRRTSYQLTSLACASRVGLTGCKWLNY